MTANRDFFDKKQSWSMIKDYRVYVSRSEQWQADLL